jgi:homocysteine S-methyltransferase
MAASEAALRRQGRSAQERCRHRQALLPQAALVCHALCVMNTGIFAPFFARRGVVVLDGALATELEASGADLRDPLWSARVLLEQPARIRDVHDAYFVAGADVAITATYQATFEGFARRGIDATTAVELFRSAVRLATESRDAQWSRISHTDGAVRPLVAASVGPYGAFLADGSEYRGDYALDEDALVDWHAARFSVLAESGADLLAVETVPCGAEARAILRLLDASPGTRAWITFTARDGLHVSNGEPFAELAAEIGDHPQVVAVGINCTAPAFIPSLVRSARAVTNTPIVVYPNSGESWISSEHRWEGEATRVSFAESAATWFASGATLIGGCCRTSPQDIRELRAWATTVPSTAAAD